MKPYMVRIGDHDFLVGKEVHSCVACQLMFDSEDAFEECKKHFDEIHAGMMFPASHTE